jgi:hypothetical protein
VPPLESRILLRAMDALSSIPYLLTFDSFEELLEIKTDSRGRRTRVLGIVLILLTFLLVCCPSVAEPINYTRLSKKITPPSRRFSKLKPV